VLAIKIKYKEFHSVLILEKKSISMNKRKIRRCNQQNTCFVNRHMDYAVKKMFIHISIYLVQI